MYGMNVWRASGAENRKPRVTNRGAHWNGGRIDYPGEKGDRGRDSGREGFDIWNVYLICAAVGGTVFVLQLILTLLGGGSHDFDGHDGSAVTDHDAHFWGIFGLRAIVAGVTAFGLGGLLVKSVGGTTLVSAPVAIGSFFAAALLVAGLLRMMGKFSSDGTARIEQSVGRPGVVYVNSQAIQQARGDVAEQEKLGEVRVAEAQREKAVLVANAIKAREIGMR